MESRLDLSKTDLKILQFLLANRSARFSIKQIAERTGLPYSTARERAVALGSRGVLEIEAINPTQTLCSIRVTERNMPILAYLEFVRKEGFLAKKMELQGTIQDILDRIEQSSFSLLLFGSQAKGTARQGSDIDVLILVPGNKDEERFARAIADAQRLTTRRLHPVIITYADFTASLKKKGASLAKEALEHHILISGAEAFYRELIVHGR